MRYGFILVDDSNDAADGNDRKNMDDQSANQEQLQYDDTNAMGGGGMQEDSNHVFNTNGNGSGGPRAMDVDEADHGPPNPINPINEREKPNPFSRNRGNFCSSNDGGGGYGMHRESPAVIVNTNLLPFIQKLHDTMRKIDVEHLFC